MNDKYMVSKANALVTAAYKLTVEEQRIILTLISFLQPQDEDFKPYIFRIAEFMELVGVDTKTKYTMIPMITKGLMKKVLEFHDENNFIQAPWLAGAKYNKGSGTVELLLSPYLKPYLLGLKSKFTTYPLENAIRITGVYSVRLYELMKSYEFRQTFEISIAKFSDMFKLPVTYSDFFNLKKRVLEPAQKEINAKTDIIFQYETITERKKVVALRFHIQANPKNAKKLNLPEPAFSKPQIPEDETENQIVNIKLLFHHNYKGELAEKFVIKMLENKGYEHIMQCLTEYRKYIDGQNIRNIAGHFYKFVMEGYTKPVAYKGNVPQRDNFDQREYSDEELESHYANLIDAKLIE